MSWVKSKLLGGLIVASSLLGAPTSLENVVQEHQEYYQNYVDSKTENINNYTDNVYNIRVSAKYLEVLRDNNSIAPVTKMRYFSLAHATATIFNQTENNITYLLTNYHVVNEKDLDIQRVKNETSLGPQFLFRGYIFSLVDNAYDRDISDDIPIELFKTNEEKDMAYFSTRDLDVESKMWKYGDSDRLEIGDFVYAITYPASTLRYVTQGIVGSLQNLEDGSGYLIDDSDFIIDATVSPGGSGGPVLAINSITGDLELVGIFHKYFDVANDMNSIIPINKIKKDLEDMLKS